MLHIIMFHEGLAIIVFQSCRMFWYHTIYNIIMYLCHLQCTLTSKTQIRVGFLAKRSMVQTRFCYVSLHLFILLIVCVVVGANTSSNVVLESSVVQVYVHYTCI